MYVVRDKKTKQVIHINYTTLGDKATPEEVYTDFDPDTMEIGKTGKSYIPEHFNINQRGEVVELTLKEKIDAGMLKLGAHQKLVKNKIVDKTIRELIKEKLVDLENYKKQIIQSYSDLSFTKRREVLPDYKLENAALGIYDEETTSNIKATVQAFRKEFHRTKGLIEKAKSLEELESVKVKFPKKLISVKKSIKNK